jgi:hypothetical protein
VPHPPVQTAAGVETVADNQKVAGKVAVDTAVVDKVGIAVDSSAADNLQQRQRSSLSPFNIRT